MLGTYEFNSRKAQIDDHEGLCIAYMYVLHVKEELAMWPEQDERRRSWVRH